MHCSFHGVFGSCLSALLVSWGLWVLFERIARFMGSLGLILAQCSFHGFIGSCLRSLLISWALWVLFERIARFIGSLGLI